MAYDSAALLLSVVATVIALVATWYTAKAFLLKSGLHIRGTYVITSTIYADDKFVSSVTLENIKDRSAIIYKIFLELSHGYFIEIDDFEEEPLILRPFEAFHRSYDPIEFYNAGMSRIKMDPLFDGKNIRRRLVLSTSEGKYVVRAPVRRWDPVSVFFRNHFTSIIHPMRSIFEGKAYGSNVRFILEMVTANGKTEVVPIHEGDHRIKKFRRFKLTPESLQSKEALEEFLLERAAAGDLHCSDLRVHDLEAWRHEAYEDWKAPPVEAAPRSWITYHIVGPLWTKWRNLQLNRMNKARAREVKKNTRVANSPERRNATVPARARTKLSPPPGNDEGR